MAAPAMLACRPQSAQVDAPAAARPPAARRRWALQALLLAGALSGCVSNPPRAALADGRPVDVRHTAQGQDSRVQFLILHSTEENLADSLRILTQQDVSAHYLLSDESPPVAYRLVDENRRAWHAGPSQWGAATQLNASSIGIEIVHPASIRGADGRIQQQPYPPQQIDALVHLIKAIVARHQIRPDRILGHSDIAPQRKTDPGPAFPWKRLADEGLIPWPDAQRVDALLAGYQQDLPDVAWFQAGLARWGYAVPTTGTLDAATRAVLAAFQMKYRPALHDGQPDAQTAAILQALLQAPVKPAAAAPAPAPGATR